MVIFSILCVTIAIGFLHKNNSASQQQINFALITKRFSHTKELENFVKKQKNSSIELWITAETAANKPNDFALLKSKKIRNSPNYNFHKSKG